MVCLSLICNNLFAQPQGHQLENNVREAIFDTLNYYTTFTREATGKNDHWAIYRFNTFQKGQKGRAWCSDFLLYGYQKNGVYPPLVTGVAYSWKKTNTLVYWPAMGVDLRRIRMSVRKMDVIVFNWSHVEGYVEPTLTGPKTIGGNTKAGRKLEGAYYPINRNWRDVRGIYNHITPWMLRKPRSTLSKI